MRDDHKDEDNKDEEAKPEATVITPGGPRARHLVHKVEPGEAVTNDKEGNPIIVRRRDKLSQA